MRQLFLALLILGVLGVVTSGAVYIATVLQWCDPLQGEKIAKIFASGGGGFLLFAYFIRRKD